MVVSKPNRSGPQNGLNKLQGCPKNPLATLNTDHDFHEADFLDFGGFKRSTKSNSFVQTIQVIKRRLGSHHFKPLPSPNSFKQKSPPSHRMACRTIGQIPGKLSLNSSQSAISKILEPFVKRIARSFYPIDMAVIRFIKLSG
ncbi:MAG: hypothetical protein DWI24_04255 [Planctomycetota bacterium]|nr:MAG: hypothetical protein DWI24_04255 [Planctomycetota bacterium]